jgi:hypothetical protein
VRRWLRRAAAFGALATAAAGAAGSGASPATLRLDYFHTGGPGDGKVVEIFALDRVVREPLAWPGSLDRTVDDAGSGDYRFEVREPGSGRLLYARGFASIY